MSLTSPQPDPHRPTPGPHGPAKSAATYQLYRVAMAEESALGVKAYTPETSAVVAECRDCLAHLLDTVPHKEQFDAIEAVGSIFCNLISSGNESLIHKAPWLESLKIPGVVPRLGIAERLSQLTCETTPSAYATQLMRQTATSFILELVQRPFTPSDGAVERITDLVKNAPTLFSDVAKACIDPSVTPEAHTAERDSLDRLHRCPILLSETLILVTKYSMPTRVAFELAKAVVGVTSVEDRNGLMRRIRLLARNEVVEITAADKRLPPPLGRPAAVGAARTIHNARAPNALGDGNVTHLFPVDIPNSAPYWEYIGNRLISISKERDERARSDELYRYLTNVLEMLAARPFFDENETYMTQITLTGGLDPAYMEFYRGVYGVDNAPAPVDSEIGSVIRNESIAALKEAALARYSLNLRKGYTRTLLSTGQWLLTEIASAVGGRSQRFKVHNIDHFPGPGCRVSDIHVENALDLSTPQSRAYYTQSIPWITTGIDALHKADIFFMRGFMALSPSFDRVSRADQRDIDGWSEATISGHPYVYIWFNDHFHSDQQPEVRMWLVPFQAFYRKMGLAVEDPRIDVNKLDLTPEGLLKESERLGLPLFSPFIGSAMWGSLANAWQRGRGPAHSWETNHSWEGTAWEDPFHIHRALYTSNYNTVMSAAVERLFNITRPEHDRIRQVLNFGHRLHRSFLTVEEAVFKGFVSEGNPPARLSLSEKGPIKPGDAGAGKGNDTHQPQNVDELNDLTPTTPRTVLLERFLEMRNQLVHRGEAPPASAFPTLELQYTGRFSRQKDTPWISGSDMFLNFPNGEARPLMQPSGRRGEVLNRVISLEERLEFEWEREFVGRFAPNNCPRIVLP